MTAVAGYKTRVLLGDFSLSTKLHQISLPVSVPMLDTTTFGDNGVKRCIPGQQSSSASMAGYLDDATHTDAVAWTTATPLTYAPFGLAFGSQVQVTDALRGKFDVSTPLTSPVGFSLEATTDGPADFGVSLHDLEAETADENGTAYDGTAATAAGGVAQLHVTAYSGLTSAVLTVEDSATGSSGWATIATFTSVTAIGAERVAVAGAVRRYLRYVLDVTGTGSVTFQLSFARR